MPGRATALSGLALLLGTAACGGHGEASYRGYVLSAEQARYEFSRASAAPGQPLANAEVILALVIDGRDARCSDPEIGRKPVDSARTGADGRYEVTATFVSSTFEPDKLLLLCVRHPDHEPFELRAVYERTPAAELNGSQLLNVFLLRSR